MPDDTGTIVFVFKYETPDGNVQSVLHFDYYPTSLEYDFFNKTYDHPYVGNCSKYQIDAVNKENVFKQFPGNEAYAQKEWDAWQKLANDGQGSIPDHHLAGTYLTLTVQGVAADCAKLDDFKPTTVPDQPAVPLTVASVEPPAGPHDPTPTPLPPTTPTATTTALVALTSTAAPLPNTGAHVGPAIDAAVALMALGAVFVWLTRKCKLNANR